MNAKTMLGSKPLPPQSRVLDIIVRADGSLALKSWRTSSALVNGHVDRLDGFIKQVESIVLNTHADIEGRKVA